MNCSTTFSWALCKRSHSLIDLERKLSCVFFLEPNRRAFCLLQQVILGLRGGKRLTVQMSNLREVLNRNGSANHTGIYIVLQCFCESLECDRW